MMIEKARDLIENQKVDVIVGVVNSSGALAVRDYLARQKVVTLITVAAAQEMIKAERAILFSASRLPAAKWRQLAR